MVRFLSGLAVCAVLGACASTSNVVPIGNNTYTATRTAGNALSRDTAALTEQAKQDAAQFCAARGKQMKLVDVVVEKPFFSTGYAKAKVVFQPVDAGSASPAAEPPPAAPREAPPPAAAPETPPPAVASEAPPPPAAPASETPAPAVAPESPAPAATASSISTDELYRELVKLDDLRKRGILTDEEFQAEKKKILARSK